MTMTGRGTPSVLALPARRSAFVPGVTPAAAGVVFGAWRVTPVLGQPSYPRTADLRPADHNSILSADAAVRDGADNAKQAPPPRGVPG